MEVSELIISEAWQIKVLWFRCLDCVSDRPHNLRFSRIVPSVFVTDCDIVASLPSFPDRSPVHKHSYNVNEAFSS